MREHEVYYEDVFEHRHVSGPTLVESESHYRNRLRLTRMHNLTQQKSERNQRIAQERKALKQVKKKDTRHAGNNLGLH